jgi:hypothetical protein
LPATNMTDSIRTDQVGKVFLVVGQNVRKCLICEQLFTRRAASEHAQIVCEPRTEFALHPRKEPAHEAKVRAWWGCK